MGATIDYRIYDDAERQIITDKFEHDCREARYEHGHAGSTGTIAEMHSIAHFHDGRCESEEVALAWLEENHEKDNGAIAVSFRAPAERTESDAEKIEAYRARVETWRSRIVKAREHAVARFKARTSEFVGCGGCGSRLSRSHLVESHCDPMPICPLCSQSLASRVDRARLDKLQGRVDKAIRELEEIEAPKFSDKVAWVVGGWCSE